MSDERREKLEARVVWLEESIEGLRRNYRRSPAIAALMLLAVPAGLLWGVLAAFYVAFMVGVLVGVWVYIAWGHLHEHETELKAVRAELRLPPVPLPEKEKPT